jgi:phage shock protein A
VLTNPDVDKGPKIPEDVDETQLKRSLTKLDDAVSDFVKSMSVVEAKNSGKAATDLNSVIQLSDNVKRSVQKLSKFAEKR